MAKRLHYCKHRLKVRIMAGDFPKWLLQHPRMDYLLACVLSTPPWIKRNEFDLKLAERDRLTKETGIEHVLDHIVPLNSKIVCGLSVPWNFKAIPRYHNGQKSNNYWPDMPMEQLPLFKE